MIITREYIYKCRSCGEKFHQIESAANTSPIAGVEPILQESESRLQERNRIAAHRCLDSRIIGLADLVGVWTHE